MNDFQNPSNQEHPRTPNVRRTWSGDDAAEIQAAASATASKHGPPATAIETGRRRRRRRPRGADGSENGAVEVGASPRARRGADLVAAEGRPAWSTTATATDVWGGRRVGPGQGRAGPAQPAELMSAVVWSVLCLCPRDRGVADTWVRSPRFSHQESARERPPWIAEIFNCFFKLCHFHLPLDREFVLDGIDSARVEKFLYLHIFLGFCIKLWSAQYCAGMLDDMESKLTQC